MDPLSFSSETLDRIFSHLSTPEIATKRSVCRTFNKHIKSSKLLNSVLDLTGFKKELSPGELSRLILEVFFDNPHPLEEVYLDIDSVWNAFVQESDGHENEFFQLLLSIQFVAKGHLLRKLCFNVGESIGELMDIRFSSSSESEIGSLLVRDALRFDRIKPLFKEILFIVPFPFTLVSDNSATSGKKFSVGQAQELFVKKIGDKWDPHGCRLFLELVEEFTGTGLTDLGFDSDPFIPSDYYEPLTPQDIKGAQEDLRFVFNVLKKSKPTLQRLSLNIDARCVPTAATDLSFNCPELRWLSLNLFRKNDEEFTSAKRPPSKTLTLPKKMASCPHLESFGLGLDGINFNWNTESLQNWFGSLEKLKTFHFNVPASSDYSPEIPVKSFEKILSSLTSLVELDLDEVSLTKSKSYSPSTIDLPNLKTLKFGTVNLPTLELFFKASMPKIETLEFVARLSENGKGMAKYKALKVEEFYPIFKAVHQSIKRMVLGHQEEQLLEAPVRENQLKALCFSELEGLKVPCDGSPTLINLLSKFEFPKLKSFELASESSSTLKADVASMLSSSAATLERITLYGSGKGDLSKHGQLSFPNLKILRLQDNMGFMQLFLNAQLNALEKVRVSAPAESTRRRVGPGRITFGGKRESLVSTEDQPLFCPQESLPILRKAASTLKEIHLYGSTGGFKTDSFVENQTPGISFPNLKVLRIDDCSTSLTNFFLKDCKFSSALQSVSIRDDEDSAGQVSFAHFLNFFKANSKSLTKVLLDGIKWDN